MLFNSFHFLWFFPLIVVIYFVIPKKIRYIWLLMASYYFYMGWNAKYAILIAASTIMTYVGSLIIEKVNEAIDEGKKRDYLKNATLIGTLAANLIILFYFKYANFFFDNVERIFNILKIEIEIPQVDVLLPVGISFYTFQALSYIIDVYRGDLKAEKNILKYALFVSFFPQLVAGPIERSKNLLEQVKNVHLINVWDYDRICNGMVLMLWGYFQKMVIADRVAIFVDTVYNKYWLYGSTALVLATLLFAVQIYCDFAGYSYIAIGAAKVMGFSLMENFNTPYYAMSIKDFWSRWHISLSSWFRDYVYIPLGGNRKGKVRKYINLMITFLVSGLWHGASWNYVVWGGIHGIYQIIGDVKNTYLKKIKKNDIREESFSSKLGKGLITFLLVDFAWLFFRANSLKSALAIIERIFTRRDIWTLFDESIYTWGLNEDEFKIMMVAIGVLILVDMIKKLTGKCLDVWLSEQQIWFRWIVIYLLLFACIIFGVYGQGYDASQFIYFQF